MADTLQENSINIATMNPAWVGCSKLFLPLKEITPAGRNSLRKAKLYL